MKTNKLYNKWLIILMLVAFVPLTVLFTKSWFENTRKVTIAGDVFTLTESTSTSILYTDDNGRYYRIDTIDSIPKRNLANPLMTYSIYFRDSSSPTGQTATTVDKIDYSSPSNQLRTEITLTDKESNTPKTHTTGKYNPDWTRPILDAINNAKKHRTFATNFIPGAVAAALVFVVWTVQGIIKKYMIGARSQEDVLGIDGTKLSTAAWAVRVQQGNTTGAGPGIKENLTTFVPDTFDKLTTKGNMDEEEQ